MSVDFYVAAPATDWPSASAAQKCMSDQGYPIVIDRFPAFKTGQIYADGALVRLGDDRAYLEGALSPSDAAPAEVALINERLAVVGESFRISSQHALMTVHARSATDVRAASYVISGLIICFGDYGFEPQGNGHGRLDFAKGLLAMEQNLRNRD